MSTQNALSTQWDLIQPTWSQRTCRLRAQSSRLPRPPKTADTSPSLEISEPIFTSDQLAVNLSVPTEHSGLITVLEWPTELGKVLNLQFYYSKRIHIRIGQRKKHIGWALGQGVFQVWSPQSWVTLLALVWAIHTWSIGYRKLVQALLSRGFT